MLVFSNTTNYYAVKFLKDQKKLVILDLIKDFRNLKWTPERFAIYYYQDTVYYFDNELNQKVINIANNKLLDSKQS